MGIWADLFKSNPCNDPTYRNEPVEPTPVDSTPNGTINPPIKELIEYIKNNEDIDIDNYYNKDDLNGTIKCYWIDIHGAENDIRIDADYSYIYKKDSGYDVALDCHIRTFSNLKDESGEYIDKKPAKLILSQAEIAYIHKNLNSIYISREENKKIRADKEARAIISGLISGGGK